MILKTTVNLLLTPQSTNFIQFLTTNDAEVENQSIFIAPKSDSRHKKIRPWLEDFIKKN